MGSLDLSPANLSPGGAWRSGGFMALFAARNEEIYGIHAREECESADVILMVRKTFRVHIKPMLNHIEGYVNEQAFRFNQRVELT